MFTSLGETMFIMPACYHPTTTLSIDDDSTFLEMLSAEISDKIPMMCFDSPKKALDYTKNKHAYLPFTERCLIKNNDITSLNFQSIRHEIYNANRFKEIFISITDYDMPHQDGIELIRNMQFLPEINQYTHIILTGKASEHFKEKLKKLSSSIGYINKGDPDYLSKLLAAIETRQEKIFQWYSYIPARLLSKNPHENTSFLFEGEFSNLFNEYLQQKNICELYLFDKQGSYVFLDKKANLSWLFVRNDTGVDKTIKLAERYQAPKSVIQALKGKKVILSLYEEEDFNNKRKINWDDYLLPASVFKSNNTYLNFFPDLNRNTFGSSDYYYAFSQDFPNNNIDKNRILSYETYLASANEKENP